MDELTITVELLWDAADAVAFIGSVLPSRRNLTGFYTGSRYLLPPSPLMQTVLNCPANLISVAIRFHIAFNTTPRPISASRYANQFLRPSLSIWPSRM
ncbi:hypothetical protein QQF64_035638 [Cirrhinus molitorella]|uniref:Uncharacterized protein n=1 Tax=Cirrhinus molitorella TaxID=172907 RepID=A0ABR3NGB8_9TELE